MDLEVNGSQDNTLKLVHFRFGPLTGLWTMHYEAKNKHWASVMDNFKILQRLHSSPPPEAGLLPVGIKYIFVPKGHDRTE